jgi:CheY-like chemotaxis protein
MTTPGEAAHLAPGQFDAALVKLAAGEGTAGIGGPVLAIGSAADIAANVVRRLPQPVEYMASPWSPLELMARLFRLLTPAAGEVGRYARTRPKIVIADDDPWLTRLVKATLGDHMDCVAAENGLLALRAIRESPPNALILDVNMPVMDGFETLRAIRSDAGLRSLPVILLTASEDVADISRAKDLRADDYMAKPFGVNDLLQRVRRVLNAGVR